MIAGSLCWDYLFGIICSFAKRTIASKFCNDLRRLIFDAFAWWITCHLRFNPHCCISHAGYEHNRYVLIHQHIRVVLTNGPLKLSAPTPMGYGVKNAVNHFQSNIPYVNLKHIPNKWTVVQVFGQLGWSKVEIQWLNWGCCYFCYWVKCCNPGLDQAKQCHGIGGHDQGPIASKMSISLGPKCRLTMKGDTEQSVLYCEQSSGVCADVHANLFDLKIKIPVLAMRSPNRWVHLHANFSFEIWLKTAIHSHFMLKMQVLTVSDEECILLCISPTNRLFN